jgi:hypothetical protein
MKPWVSKFSHENAINLGPTLSARPAFQDEPKYIVLYGH